MKANRSGFTMVEMLVAVIILGVGLLALAAGSGFITRSLQGSRISTQAAQAAADQMDRLRSIARSTAVPCSSANFTSQETPQARAGSLVLVSWSITPTSGKLRNATVTTTYRVARDKVITQTYNSTILCS